MRGGGDGIGHGVVLSGSGDTRSCPARARRTNVSSKVAGTTARRRARRRRRGRRGRPAGRRPAREGRVPRGRRAGRPRRAPRTPGPSARPARRRRCRRRRCRRACPRRRRARRPCSTRRSHSPGLVEVVRGDEHAGAGDRRLVDRLPERRPGVEPHAGGRLVQHEQFRPVRERGGEGEAPAQAERQVADERGRGRREVGLERRRRSAEGLGREREVLGDAQVLPEPQSLRDVAEPPARLSRGRAAEQQHPPGRRAEQAEQEPQQGGLAGAVGAHEPDHLAGAHLEVHAVDRRERAEPAYGLRGDGERLAPRGAGPAAAVCAAAPGPRRTRLLRRAARPRRRRARGRPRAARRSRPARPRRDRWWRRAPRPRPRRPRRSAARARRG